MSVRAEWNLAGLTESDDDPFGMLIYSPGVEIDLTSSEEELVAAMESLWRRERYMRLNGLSCEFKDAGQGCDDCPHATLEPTERRSRLCRLGKDEEAIWARHEEVRRARLSNVTELAELVDEVSEIGTLSPELEELLTQVSP